MNNLDTVIDFGSKNLRLGVFDQSSELIYSSKIKFIEDSKNNISKLIEEKKFEAVFDEIEKNNGFNLTRLERDKAINNCIEYTKTLFKLDNVELMESFLKNSLKA